MNDPFSNYTLDYSTPVDPALQAELERIDSELRSRYGMTSDQAAAGVLDLETLRLAMIHPDRGEYGASLPKLGILLAYFQLHSKAAGDLDPRLRHELGLMTKASDNLMASKFSQELGLGPIQAVLHSYGFYDSDRGGGMWMGKHFGRDGVRIGDPVGDHSHAATVRQVLRYFLLLEQGKLVSPEASGTMREILASPDIPHDPVKFVQALQGREVRILRKWGSWDDWRHDAALITGPGRHYILVGLTHHPRGDAYLTDLARSVDDVLCRPFPNCAASEGGAPGRRAAGPPRFRDGTID